MFKCILDANLQYDHSNPNIIYADVILLTEKDIFDIAISKPSKNDILFGDCDCDYGPHTNSVVFVCECRLVPVWEVLKVLTKQTISLQEVIPKQLQKRIFHFL